MLSNIKAIVPENLIQLSKKTPKVPVAIVCAHQESVIESAKQACDLNLIDPIFIGIKSQIINEAEQLIKNGVKELPKFITAHTSSVEGLITLKLLTVKMIKTLQLKQQVLLKKIK